jgi:hypothetical protein
MHQRDHVPFKPSYLARASLIFARASCDKSYAIDIADANEDAVGRMAVKAAVGFIDTDSAQALVPLKTASDTFAPIVAGRSILDSFPRARRLPYGQALSSVISGVLVQWVGEGSPAPVRKFGVENTDALPLHKVSTIVAFSQEVAKLSDTLAQRVIDEELSRAAAAAVDASFLDPTNAGSASRPASIFYGSGILSSSGTPEADIEALAQHLDGDLTRSALVMHPLLALRLSMYRDSGGSAVFPNIGTDGGSIGGIRVITSINVPSDTGSSLLGLIDPDGIVLPLEMTAELALSKNASIVMNDAPSAPAQQVSMFQANAFAARVTMSASWMRARDGAVTSMMVPY